MFQEVNDLYFYLFIYESKVVQIIILYKKDINMEI